MTISRRSFVMGATSASFALLNGTRLLAEEIGRFENELKIPAPLEATAGAAGKRYELTAAVGNSKFFSGGVTPTIGFNGNYLGPTIRCRAGDHVTIHVKNALSEPTTVHWHGLHVPARFDGGPHQSIEPGMTWEPSFEIKQKASLCWYHAHQLGRTGEQVLRGLAGLFLIEDDESASLGLPSEYGVDDIPLVIQDRRFLRDGRFDYLSAMPDAMMGYKGNAILVNGTFLPHVNLRRRRTRFRILNGSNSRIYTLGRDDGAYLLVIGTDGSLLERPVRQRRLRLGPAERVELLLDMQENQSVRLMSYPDTVNSGRMGGGMMMGGMMGGMAGNTETFPIIELPRGQVGERRLSTARDAHSGAELDRGAGGAHAHFHPGHGHDGNGWNDGARRHEPLDGDQWPLDEYEPDRCSGAVGQYRDLGDSQSHPAHPSLPHS